MESFDVTALNAALTEPGKRLAFIDDTDIAGQPVPSLEPDLRILIAVELTSDAYAAAAVAMTTKLAELDMNEFHATEIINPKTGSPWKALPPAERLAAMHCLAEIFREAGPRGYFLRVPKGQFAALKAETQQLGPVNVGFKHGLKRAALRCLFDHLADLGDPAMIVIDQDKPLDAPVIEDWPEAKFLVGGGPIAARSSDVPGLQLADLLAWSVNRYACRRPAIAVTELSGFDEVAATILGELGELPDLLAIAQAIEAKTLQKGAGRWRAPEVLAVDPAAERG